MSSRLFRSALPVLLGLALSVGVLGTAAAQDKVVYHIDESSSKATKALRNIRNYLDVEPKTTVLVVAHGLSQAHRLAEQVFVLRDGARVGRLAEEVFRDKEALLAAMDELL